ncbi:MAG: CAP domain-containing protein [Pyrinomonadaceae bacterium]
MTCNSLFPHFCVRVRGFARYTFAAFACLFASGLFVGADAQTNTMRPVARLIGVRTTGSVSTPRAATCETGARMMPASMFNASAAARPRTTTYAVAASVERRAFELINAQRRTRGESPLIWDAELTRMARLHSDSMAQRNFFDHTNPQGQNMMMRARSGGVCGWRAMAENIAYNEGYDDPAAFAVERWLISPKHRENILREDFTHSGIGVARAADGRVFFTQVFVTR